MAALAGLHCQRRSLQGPEHVWSTDEILAAVAEQAPVFLLGEDYSYSNTNYLLLGEILAAAEGRPWRDVVRTRVIDRAGLANTRLPAPGHAECPAPCARGYEWVEDERYDLTDVDPSLAQAAGGHALVTTPSDLTRFHQRLLAGALFEHPETLDLMLAFQPGPEPQQLQIGYGLGMAQFEFDGYEIIGHMGGTAGYWNYMLYLPATDRYLSGFINLGGNTENAAVLLPLLERLLRVDPQPQYVADE